MDKQKCKALRDQYKEEKTFMGVVGITNTQNGKILIVSYPNVRMWRGLDGVIASGKYAEFNMDVQKYGQAAFIGDILEKQPTEDAFDIRFELRQMEKKWLDKLEPYEDKGYNRRKE